MDGGLGPKLPAAWEGWRAAPRLQDGRRASSPSSPACDGVHAGQGPPLPSPPAGAHGPGWGLEAAQGRAARPGSQRSPATPSQKAPVGHPEGPPLP